MEMKFFVTVEIGLFFIKTEPKPNFSFLHTPSFTAFAEQSSEQLKYFM